ncbi:unnamed protein product [Oikopleura dioica]|uniref:G-protein coupled receptors family 1 profile domain-containing protein n=1 Tax=Oikopleura dioica TaxID=34765 RepID=E4XB23_OIKDI|nr:unnamed protein product [Oikopleura dioica]
MLTVNFLMPLFSVIIMYGLIVRRVRRSGRKSQRANMQMYERRVTFRVLIVIGTYCVCWSPYYIYGFLLNINLRHLFFEEFYILSVFTKIDH